MSGPTRTGAPVIPMKPKISPRDHEVKLDDDEFIVSKTDLSGRITYVNRTFMLIAGYPEAQLLHKQHNVIRHPDMPRGVFRFLWDTLKSGQEFFGYVKNMTSDGSYYWVFANVTVDQDAAGKPKGYYSVRRKPNPKALSTLVPIYREMLAIEKRSPTGSAPEQSLQYLQRTLSDLNTSYEKLVLGLQAG